LTTKFLFKLFIKVLSAVVIKVM